MSLEYFIWWLLKRFREYEHLYTADRNDHVEWRHEFLDFVLWLISEEK